MLNFQIPHNSSVVEYEPCHDLCLNNLMTGFVCIIRSSTSIDVGVPMYAFVTRNNNEIILVGKYMMLIYVGSHHYIYIHKRFVYSVT